MQYTVVASMESSRHRRNVIGRLQYDDTLQGGGFSGPAVSPSYPESNSMRQDSSVAANLMALGFGSQDS